MKHRSRGKELLMTGTISWGGVEVSKTMTSQVLTSFSQLSIQREDETRPQESQRHARHTAFSKGSYDAPSIKADRCLIYEGHSGRRLLHHIDTRGNFVLHQPDLLTVHSLKYTIEQREKSYRMISRYSVRHYISTLQNCGNIALCQTSTRIQYDIDEQHDPPERSRQLYCLRG